MTRRPNKSLRDALTAEYNRLAGEKGGEKTKVGQVVPDPFAEMFENAAEEIYKRYIEGTIDYIREHHSELYQKMNEAEDRLDEGWKAGLQGKIGIEDFQKILNEWYLLHLQGIEIYSKEQGIQGQ